VLVGAERALERALDLAEPERILLPFLLYPAPELCERHRRQLTGHPALITASRTCRLGASSTHRRTSPSRCWSRCLKARHVSRLRLTS
jgi:LuxR family maltose regulon positive regulatory protein